MQSTISTSRKRAVNLTLNAGLVTQAKSYTNNLSATMEMLLTEYIAAQQKSQLTRRQLADACAEEWNNFLTDHGSFAEEYNRL